MFSFFRKKKPEVSDPHAELRLSVDKLRSELGVDSVMKGMELNARIDRLRSVKLEFIQSLLELTDQITDRIREQYQGFGPLMVLEIDAFCAAIVATAVMTTDIPENEAREVIDIYLGLWTETAVKNHPGVVEATLKAQMDTLWLEYSRLILKTCGEQTPQIMVNEDSPTRVLVRSVDRLARVQREEDRESVAAITFKVAISEALRIVTANAS